MQKGLLNGLELVVGLLNLFLNGLLLQLRVNACVEFVHYRVVLVSLLGNSRNNLRPVIVRSGLSCNHIHILLKQAQQLFSPSQQNWIETTGD